MEVSFKSMTDWIKKLVEWFSSVTDLLKSIFVFSVIAGLLFNDPFGVLTNVGTFFGNFGDKGVAGLISLLMIVLLYKK